MSFFERYLSVWVGLCMLFGVASPVALVTIVGVLFEVPIMLGLVRYANKTRDQFS